MGRGRSFGRASKCELRPKVNESFDENRFVAILDLAGPLVALELAERLDEDLTGVAQSLDQAGKIGDHRTMRSQSHVLLAIAGTVGATRLHELSGRLNAGIRTCEPTNVGELLSEIAVAIEELITRVRRARREMMLKT